ncbi:MAG TPA: ACP S-malonyltransferase [Actinomycetota bacterium]|nr:ACP S-malonyltransferase [Actinomycetota bacterium]
MRAALFPGQGVDAAALLDALADAPLLGRANELAGRDLAAAVARCVDRAKPVVPTDVAQPALLVAGLASHDRHVSEHGPFDFYAGHSVGEYAALAAAGAIEPDVAIRLVCVRGRAMRAAARAAGGGMAAVKGVTLAELESICARAGAVVANDNSPAQLVVSGSDAALAEVAALVRLAGGRCLLLSVEGPFHSPAVKAAAGALRDALDRAPVRMPPAPVVSNVTARPYRAPGEVRSLLVRQLTERVRFRESIEWIAATGGTEFVDLGPGKVTGKLAAATVGAAVHA